MRQIVKLITSGESSALDSMSEDLTALLWCDLARSLAEFEDAINPVPGVSTGWAVFVSGPWTAHWGSGDESWRLRHCDYKCSQSGELDRFGVGIAPQKSQQAGRQLQEPIVRCTSTVTQELCAGCLQLGQLRTRLHELQTGET
jgi:hypothetical protein